MPATLAERREAAQKRLQRINDTAFDHVAALEKLRKERLRLIRSLKTMRKKPKQFAKKDPADDIAEAVAPQVARAVTESVARRERAPPGSPDGLARAHAKLAAQGHAPRRARRGGA